MLAIVVGIIGPLVTKVSVGQYLSDPKTAVYAVGNAFIYPVQYKLPGVFVTNPLDSVNGSLWTLRLEIAAYIVLGALGLIGLVRRRWLLALGASAGLVAWVTALHPFLPAYIATLPTYDTLDLLALFAGGAAMRWITISGRWTIVACAALFASQWLPISFVQYICLPYIVIYLGTRQWGALGAVRRLGDPSYGMYIWAFPLQQLLLLEQPHLSIALLAIEGTEAATVAGYVSWHLVESRALQASRRYLRRVRERPVLVPVGEPA